MIFGRVLVVFVVVGTPSAPVFNDTGPAVSPVVRVSSVCRYSAAESALLSQFSWCPVMQSTIGIKHMQWSYNLNTYMFWGLDSIVPVGFCFECNMKNWTDTRKGNVNTTGRMVGAQETVSRGEANILMKLDYCLLLIQVIGWHGCVFCVCNIFMLLAIIKFWDWKLFHAWGRCGVEGVNVLLFLFKLS